VALAPVASALATPAAGSLANSRSMRAIATRRIIMWLSVLRRLIRDREPNGR